MARQILFLLAMTTIGFTAVPAHANDYRDYNRHDKIDHRFDQGSFDCGHREERREYDRRRESRDCHNHREEPQKRVDWRGGH